MSMKSVIVLLPSNCDKRPLILLTGQRPKPRFLALARQQPEAFLRQFAFAPLKGPVLPLSPRPSSDTPVETMTPPTTCTKELRMLLNAHGWRRRDLNPRPSVLPLGSSELSSPVILSCVAPQPIRYHPRILLMPEGRLIPKAYGRRRTPPPAHQHVAAGSQLALDRNGGE